MFIKFLQFTQQADMNLKFITNMYSMDKIATTFVMFLFSDCGTPIEEKLETRWANHSQSGLPSGQSLDELIVSVLYSLILIVPFEV